MTAIYAKSMLLNTGPVQCPELFTYSCSPLLSITADMRRHSFEVFWHSCCYSTASTALPSTFDEIVSHNCKVHADSDLTPELFTYLYAYKASIRPTPACCRAEQRADRHMGVCCPTIPWLRMAGGCRHLRPTGAGDRRSRRASALLLQLWTDPSASWRLRRSGGDAYRSVAHRPGLTGDDIPNRSNQLRAR